MNVNRAKTSDLPRIDQAPGMAKTVPLPATRTADPSLQGTVINREYRRAGFFLSLRRRIIFIFGRGLCKMTLMAFVRMKGIEGLLYVPDDNDNKKKHPCEDCHCCQWCSDNRCSLCLGNTSCSKASNKDETSSDGSRSCKKSKG